MFPKPCQSYDFLRCATVLKPTSLDCVRGGVVASDVGSKAYDTTKFDGPGKLKCEIKKDTHFFVQFTAADGPFPPDDLVVRRLTLEGAQIDRASMCRCNSRKQVLAYVRGEKARAPADLANCTDGEILAEHILWASTEDLLNMEAAFRRLSPPASNSCEVDWGTIFHHLGVVLPTDRCSPQADEDFWALLLFWKDPQRFAVPDTTFCRAISFNDLPTTAIGLAQWLRCRQATADATSLTDRRGQFLQQEETDNVDWHNVAEVLQRTFVKELPKGLQPLDCYEAVLSWVAPALYPPRAFGITAEERICDRFFSDRTDDLLVEQLNTYSATALRAALKGSGLDPIPSNASRADIARTAVFCRADMLDETLEVSFKVARAVCDLAEWLSHHDTLPCRVEHSKTSLAREQRNAYEKLRLLRLQHKKQGLSGKETDWIETKLGKTVWTRDVPCARFYPGSLLSGSGPHRHEYAPSGDDSVARLDPVSCYLCGHSLPSFDELLDHVKAGRESIFADVFIGLESVRFPFLMVR